MSNTIMSSFAGAGEGRQTLGCSHTLGRSSEGEGQELALIIWGFAVTRGREWRLGGVS